MMMDLISYAAVVLLVVSSLVLLVSQNWRISILALAVLYLGAFWLVSLQWPLGLAAAKLVVGWMAGAVLGASQPASQPASMDDLYEDRPSGFSGPVFRLIAAGLVGVLVISILPLLEGRFPGSAPALWGGALLVGMGLLHLGMTTRPLRVVLGLLTLLSGFEILYASVEVSVLVAGLQAVLTLGLALVGAYLLAAPSMES